ncbi:MAG: hypothetical protein C0P63_012835 [Actinomycetales bacterium]
MPGELGLADEEGGRQPPVEPGDLGALTGAGPQGQLGHPPGRADRGEPIHDRAHPDDAGERGPEGRHQVVELPVAHDDEGHVRPARLPPQQPEPADPLRPGHRVRPSRADGDHRVPARHGQAEGLGGRLHQLRVLHPPVEQGVEHGVRPARGAAEQLALPPPVGLGRGQRLPVDRVPHVAGAVQQRGQPPGVAVADHREEAVPGDLGAEPVAAHQRVEREAVLGPPPAQLPGVGDVPPLVARLQDRREADAQPFVGALPVIVVRDAEPVSLVLLPAPPDELIREFGEAIQQAHGRHPQHLPYLRVSLGPHSSESARRPSPEQGSARFVTLGCAGAQGRGARVGLPQRLAAPGWTGLDAAGCVCLHRGTEGLHG